MILLGVTILLVIGFFVMLALSYKTWRVYTVILVFLNFAAGIVFFYMAARTLATHRAWQEEAIKYQQGLALRQAEVEVLRIGQFDQEGKLLQHGERQVRNLLNRAVNGRGSVWRQASPGAVLDAAVGSIQVAIPNGGVQLDPGEIVYVFDEAPIEQGGRYVGAFNVAQRADDGTTADLVPLHRLTAAEAKQVTDSRGPWILYEIMPPDRHEPFVQLNPDGGEPDFTKLSDERIRELLSGVDAKDVAQYERDLGPADENDPEDVRWVHVEFLKEISLDVDNPDRFAVQWRDKGQSSLPAKIKVDYVPGNKTLVDWKTFQELKGQNPPAVQIDPAAEHPYQYRRPLHDYAQALENDAGLLARLADEKKRLEYELNLIDDALTKAQGRLSLVKAEQTKVAHDVAGFQNEQQGLTQYRQLLEKHLTDVVAELRRLFRENQQLASKLETLQKRALQQAQGRTPATPTALGVDEPEL